MARPCWFMSRTSSCGAGRTFERTNEYQHLVKGARQASQNLRLGLATRHPGLVSSRLTAMPSKHRERGQPPLRLPCVRTAPAQHASFAGLFSFLCRRRHAEVLAILTRRDFEMAHKAATQQLRTGKAATVRDLLHAVVRRCQLSSGSFDASLLDIVCRCDAELEREHPSEVAGAHGRALRKYLDREIFRQILGDPDL